jgi:hypothetical protein
MSELESLSKLFVFLIIIFSLSFDINASNDEHIYLQVQKEYESGLIDEALWSKAITLSSGDIEKAKYKYISLKVEKILSNKGSKHIQTIKEKKEIFPNQEIEILDLDQEIIILDKEIEKTDLACFENPERKLLYKIYQNNGLDEASSKAIVCGDLLGITRNLHKEGEMADDLKYIGSFNFGKQFYKAKIARDFTCKFSNSDGPKIRAGCRWPGEADEFISRYYIDFNSLSKTSVDCGKKLNKRKINDNDYRQFYLIEDTENSYWTPKWKGAFYRPDKDGVKETKSSANLTQFQCKTKKTYQFLSRSFYSENNLKGELLKTHQTTNPNKNSAFAEKIENVFPVILVNLPLTNKKGLKIFSALNDYICELPNEKFIDNTNQNNANTCSNPKTFEYLRN